MGVMRRRRLLVMFSVPLLALLMLFGVVNAGDSVVTDSVPPKPTNWTETLTFPKFNPISGTLTSVEISDRRPGVGKRCLRKSGRGAFHRLCWS